MTNQEHSVPVRNVWLRRDGADTVVEVELEGGRYYEVIREHGECFSHCVSSYGIQMAQAEGKLASWERARAFVANMTEGQFHRLSVEHK